MIEDAGTGIPVQEGERRMGRLIDADKLKEQIHCAYSDDLEILEKIDAQPTDYDPDKVAEQLEDYSNADEAERIGTIPVIELDDAIKIVKGGGVDA